ncbi:MAG TPA: 2-C-methyl-D-erythritol 4-phosphate cytidylyltransferase [Sulfuricaulis sp.]|nr:2-C-methyl-D-erythritol 4-phosphate cytidylyltransferase [Sulfuricaulis sp.]
MTAADGIWALVPAGGRGLRMQAPLPKQYLSLLGRPVILHTLERLCTHPRVRGVMAGVSDQDRHWQALIPMIANLPKFLGKYSGGETRAHTVLNGLKALRKHAKSEDWVLVHDAVRPCLRHADVDKLISAVGDGPEGGLLAFPVSDTVKRVDNEGRVVETVRREGLWRAATPQMFRIGALANALESALMQRIEITDEASAIEATGGHPRVVACHVDNLKITLSEDLALAELYLKQQQGET